MKRRLSVIPSKRIVISNYKKNGQLLQQVVYIGKDETGRKTSVTRHESAK